MPALSNLQLPPTDSSSQALATSDSFSLLSEPPDIRNWFASYVYDSPELNTLGGLQDLDVSEETCIGGVNGEKFEKLRKKGGFEEAPLVEMKESLNGIVNPIEIDESDRKCAAVDIHDIEPKNTLSIQNQSTLKRIGKHKLPGETGCNNHGSVINSRAASMYDQGDKTKLEHSLLDITNCNSLFQEKSIRRNVTKSSQQKENLSDATSGTLGLTVKEDSWKGPFETAKENDGFVSTRKKGRQSNSVNLMPKDGLQCVTVTNFEKGANRSGKVLFDKSDFHYSNVHGDTGKWECPQRNKPNLGPPLKQLRLEHWVRRA